MAKINIKIIIFYLPVSIFYLTNIYIKDHLYNLNLLKNFNKFKLYVSRYIQQYFLFIRLHLKILKADCHKILLTLYKYHILI